MTRAAERGRRSREAPLSRLAHAWRALTPDRRLAATASLGLFATMLLPWYQQNAVVTNGRGEPLVSRNLSAFGVFSFVEAAILLVALAVLALLFARAERRDFHLPGGDGTAVMIGGAWAALLLVWRLFDKPGITTRGVAANVGIQWGIFFALAAAGLIAYAGSRMRAGRRPEPPVVEEPPPRRAPEPPGTAVTRVLAPERPRATPREEAPTARTERRRPAPRPRSEPTPYGDQLTMPLGSEPPLADDER